MAQVNSEIIPDKPVTYPSRYDKYPFSKIRLVYLIGNLKKD